MFRNKLQKKILLICSCVFLLILLVGGLCTVKSINAGQSDPEGPKEQVMVRGSNFVVCYYDDPSSVFVKINTPSPYNKIGGFNPDLLSGKKKFKIIVERIDRAIEALRKIRLLTKSTKKVWVPEKGVWIQNSVYILLRTNIIFEFWWRPESFIRSVSYGKRETIQKWIWNDETRRKLIINYFNLVRRMVDRGVYYQWLKKQLACKILWSNIKGLFFELNPNLDRCPGSITVRNGVYTFDMGGFKVVGTGWDNFEIKGPIISTMEKAFLSREGKKMRFSISYLFSLFVRYLMLIDEGPYFTASLCEKCNGLDKVVDITCYIYHALMDPAFEGQKAVLDLWKLIFFTSPDALMK